MPYLPPALVSTALVAAGLFLGPPVGELARGNAAHIGRTFGPGETVRLERDDHRMASQPAIYRYNPAGKPTVSNCTGLDEDPGKRPYRTPTAWEHVGTLSMFYSTQVRCDGPPGTRFAIGVATTDLDADFASYLVVGGFLLQAILVIAIWPPHIYHNGRSTKRHAPTKWAAP
jgi:hypothetical protein